MWLLILMALVSPVSAQEYRKIDEKTVEIKENSIRYIDAQEATEKIARLEEARDNAIALAAGYQDEIDALNDTFETVGIDRVKVVEDIKLENGNAEILEP